MGQAINVKDRSRDVKTLAHVAFTLANRRRIGKEEGEWSVWLYSQLSGQMAA
jgi:hypothetical protein